MSKNTAHKTILVLGGTGYVGSAIVRQLAGAGHQVLFSYHNNITLADALCQQFQNVRSFALNAMDSDAFTRDLTQALTDYDSIDGLVQCIGTAGDTALYKESLINSADKLLQTTLAEWQTQIAITTTSTFLACQAVTPLMQTHGGNIVFIGSIDGIKPMPAPVHYAAAKGAIAAMTPALAKQLGSLNIRVNHIAVGLLDQGLSAVMPDRLQQEYSQYCATRRVGTAQEIAASATWYVLENTYITGQQIVLDGGL